MPTFTTSGVPLHKWPHAFKPSEITLHLRFSTSTFTSPYTQTSQTTELAGGLHQLEAGFPPVPPAKVGELRAFFASLRGGAGRFIFPAVPCRYEPPAMYAAERTTIVALTVDTTHIGADSTLITADATQIRMESVFTVSSAPNPVTIIGTLWFNSNAYPLKVGGAISWDDASGWRHLHVITAMAHNTTTGAATLTVEPPMLERPTVTTPMHVHAPSGVFRLADDGQGALRQAGRLSNFSIAAVQAYPLSITVTP